MIIKRTIIPWALVLCFLFSLALFTGCFSETTTGPGPSATGNTVRIADLPVEARNTLELIKRGGPFPYDQDGSVFHNYEKLLPAQPDGYYHEYTVVTPGSSDRGARRIIAGKPGEYYYTGDHYSSFKLILE